MANEHGDWWADLLAERRRQGERDAEEGAFNWPHLSEWPDPQNVAENAAYKEGFSQRRKELGKTFKWRV